MSDPQFLYGLRFGFGFMLSVVLTLGLTIGAVWGFYKVYDPD